MWEIVPKWCILEIELRLLFFYSEQQRHHTISLFQKNKIDRDLRDGRQWLAVTETDQLAASYSDNMLGTWWRQCFIWSSLTSVHSAMKTITPVWIYITATPSEATVFQFDLSVFIIRRSWWISKIVLGYLNLYIFLLRRTKHTIFIFTCSFLGGIL